MRVLTGIDADGRSVIVEQGPAPSTTPVPEIRLEEQWTQDGAVFRLVGFAPDPEGHMHRTETVDLATVVAGELVLALEGGEEVTLRVGDTVVQRGATHAWRNRTDHEALLAVVILPAGESA